MKEKTTIKSFLKYRDLDLILISMFFGFGYLMIIVNGYYHFKYLEFLRIGRKDLIVRLGFLSHTNGVLFYPTSIIWLAIIFWFKNNQKGKNLLKKLFMSLIGLLIPAILFYGNIELNILFGTKEKWIIGLILINVVIFILMRKKTD